MAPLNVFLGQSVAARSAAARLGSLFAFLSLLLAGLGIYGLVSHWVAHRTGEFGIRTALGAGSGSVLRMIAAQCLRMTGVGWAASFLPARLISSFLYGMPALDSLTFTVAPLILLLIALLAASRPAFRATRINPVDALRSE